jgi:hypothetical protein
MNRRTQYITADAQKWQMREPNHQLSWSPDAGTADLTIRKCRDGILEVCATEEGKRTKQVFITLNPDTVQSLREFLNGAEEQGAK